MSVVEHLEELRSRLLISVIAITVGAIAGWFLFDPVFDLLKRSYVDACLDLPAQVQPANGCNVLFGQRVTEPFLIRFKVSLFTGLLIALPVVLYELWRFVTPGLTKRERRMAIPFVLSSVSPAWTSWCFPAWTSTSGSFCSWFSRLGSPSNSR
jgi:sec-independent protein translocase protein TatC